MNIFAIARAILLASVGGLASWGTALASPIILIGADAVWKYHADGTDFGSAWRELNFNDSAWASGPAQLGYGDGDEMTVVPTPFPRPATAYFRKLVDLPTPQLGPGLQLRLLRDDGAVVYINGVEVLRNNMPAGAVTHATLATAAVGGAEESTVFIEATVPASTLVAGMNVIAVEVHQNSVNSSDMSFNLELIASPGPPEVPQVTVVASDPEAREFPPFVDAFDPGRFTISRTGNTNDSLRVFFALSGTASNGLDYYALDQFVDIPEGAASADVEIVPQSDPEVEPTETVVLALLFGGFCHSLVITNLVADVACYTIGQPSEATVLIHHFGDPPNNAPTVTLFLPQDGAAFTAPANIHLRAAAQDMEDGYDKLQVEFFVGANRIGAGVFIPSLCPAPYCPSYDLTWSNVPPGDYAITAKVTDSAGAVAVSSPAHITVRGEPETTVVNVMAIDPDASEVSLNAAINAGRFAIRRMGNVDSPVTVFFTLGGSASNGVDYGFVTNRVLIPAGATQAVVTINPLFDNLVEGIETVLLTLEPIGCIAIFPPPPGCYQIGESDHATVSILDGSGGSNQPPTISMVTPTNDTIFANGRAIILGANASAPGGVQRVDFFRNATLIATATGPVPSPFGGWVGIWSNAPPGAHTLFAVVTGSQGARGTSAPVNITILAGTNLPLVTVAAIASSTVENAGLLGAPYPPIGFQVTRSGPADLPLMVHYELSGSAQNGVDYTELAETVEIPAGDRSAFVIGQPIDDALIEGAETVVLTLIPPFCAAVFPPLPGCYVVGPSNRATMLIHDDDTAPTNEPPFVQLNEPQNGAVFAAPATIELRAYAQDMEDHFDLTVEFFAGADRIGAGTFVATTCPAPYCPFFAFTWSNVPPGTYTLTAKATDSAGASKVSEPVIITAKSAGTGRTVTTTADSGPGSLRAVIADAPSGATIDFVVTGAITLTSGEIQISRSLNIAGPGANILAVQRGRTPGTPEFRLFNISGNEVVIAGLTIRDGRVGTDNAYVDGAGIHNNGNLVLNHCVMSGNDAAGEYSRGGAICNRGTLVVSHSTFSGNACSGFYGEGGAIYNYGKLAATNCTFSGNSVGGWGGAIHNDGLSEGTTIDSCTFTKNSAGFGGGIFNRGNPPYWTSPVHLRNTIIVGNTGQDIGHTSVIESGGYNLIGTIGDPYGNGALGLPFVPGPGDRINVTAAQVNLGPLQLNGARTPTHVLLQPSLAINAGPLAGFPPTDQRGVGRPFGPRSDIGAFESEEIYNAPPLVNIVNPTSGSVFALGEAIRIEVQASDADGLPGLCEIFDGPNKIAEGPFIFIGPLFPCGIDFCPPAVGVFFYSWTDASPGPHTLTARVTDSGGALAISEPVHISVESLMPTTVNVTAPDPQAGEPGLASFGKSAHFTIIRRGNVDLPLTVRFSLGGSASNGVDYLYVSNRVVIPAGATQALVPVTPLFDNRVEGNETVVLTLSPVACIASFPPPPGCYTIGPSNQATVFIADFPPHTNSPPIVSINQPQDGDVFTAPADIMLWAEASDSDGWIQSIEFFEGNRSLGFGTMIPTACPINDLYCPAAAILTWSNVPPGNYAITAKATDSNGAATVSEPVNVVVVSSDTLPLVTIEPTASGAAEGSDDFNTFVVRRSGIANTPLTVRLNISGTAQNGLDYTQVPNHVVILAGQSEAQFKVYPIDDSLIEGDETVSVTIEPVECDPPTAFPVKISGQGYDHPQAWHLSVSAESEANGVSGQVSVLGGATGPVIQIVPPNDDCDCWCFNARRTDTEPGTDQRVNVYLRDTGDGITTFDQFGLVTSIGGDCNSISTADLHFLTLIQGDFQVESPDSDGDAVPDYSDRCPNTAPGVQVNEHGCSIGEIVTCGGYRVGSPSNAVVVIRDNDRPATPVVEITQPHDGDVFTTPADIFISAHASDPDGWIQTIEFFAGDRSLGFGTMIPTLCPINDLYCPATAILTWSNVPPGNYALTARATDNSGASAVSSAIQVTVTGGGSTPVTLISTGSIWKYLDDGSDQGVTWTAPAISDSAWPSGSAQLGYGDGDEATVVGFGPPNDKFITTWFRHGFQIANAASVRSLRLRLMRDDGAVVYLNGHEIFRSNMPDGEITYRTLASAVAMDNEWVAAELPPTHLLSGNNMLAVEIHQVSPVSSDISFDLELTAEVDDTFYEITRVDVVAIDAQASEASVTSSIDFGAFAIRRTGNLHVAIPVRFTLSGTASNGVDYNVVSNSIVIPAGSTQALVVINPRFDQIAEGTETVVLALVDSACPPIFPPTPECYGVGPNAQATVFISDFGPVGTNLPVVRVFASDSNIIERVVVPGEPADIGRFTFTRTGNTNVPLTIPFEVSGTAAPGLDYSEIVFRSVTIPPGLTAVHFVVAAFDDLEVEPDETIVVTLLPSVAFQYFMIGEPASATVVIHDDEAVVTESLIQTGSVWKYLDDGSDQGTAWRELAFDDDSWKSGPAQLGYGDGDEATVVSFGPDPFAKYITTYFRKRFEVHGPVVLGTLRGRLLEDDGAVVYLNGVEIFRSNMPEGPVAFDTLASITVGDNQMVEFSIPLGPLVPPSPLLRLNDVNVVAVEIHEARQQSSDISFDLELTLENDFPRSPPVINVVATDLNASEAGPLAFISDSGTFTFYRDENIDLPLTVLFSLDGTAENGADYFHVTEQVEFAPGAATAQVNIVPITDAFAEGTETVVLTVLAPFCPAIFPIPPGCYHVGLSNKATVFIADFGGPTNPPPATNITLIATGSVWKYLHDGSNQGTAWREPNFNDEAWYFGLAQFGYGDGDEATWILAPNGEKYITYYFRRVFEVSDPAAFKELTIRLLRDDGGVVYLNGVEVFRSNMPDGPVNYLTPAIQSVCCGDESTNYYSASVGPALLASGLNVLAVEIHQYAITSADVSFDLELIGSTGGALATAPELALQPMSYASFVIRADGHLYSWGDNTWNELGHGNGNGSHLPAPATLPPGVPGWNAVASGYGHTLAITRNAQLYAWGDNDEGQLGLGDRTDRSTPILVPRPDGVTGWIAVAAGGYHSLAISTEGRLYEWGGGKFPLRTSPTPLLAPVGVARWLKVAAGQNHSLALADNGEIYGWGENEFGQLGSSAPLAGFTPELGRTLRPAGVARWKTLVAGGAHSLGIADDSRLYAWGGNFLGQLGTVACPAMPLRPSSFQRRQARAVGEQSQAARGTASASPVMGGFSVGAQTTMGKSALGTTNLQSVTTPTLVAAPPGATGWRAVSAGYWHSLALGDDCEVYAWGGNGQGQLGYESGGYSAAPRVVSGLGDLCNAPHNSPPTVAIVEPASGDVFDSPRVIQIEAVTRDSDGYADTVHFFANNQELGESHVLFIQPPQPGEPIHFEFTWANPPPGEYTLHAVTTDDHGASGTSAPVHITIRSSNAPTVVLITSPTNGSIFAHGVTIPIVVQALDPDAYNWPVLGEIFDGTNKIGEGTFVDVGPLFPCSTDDPDSCPKPVWLLYFGWANAPVGSHTLHAVTTDNLGAHAISDPVHITVTGPPTNAVPEVTISSPVNGSVFAQGATIRIRVHAQDADGLTGLGEIFDGANKLAEGRFEFLIPLVVCPEDHPDWCPRPVGVLAFDWTNAPSGVHTLRAVATDNSGARGTSAPVHITVVGDLPPRLVRIDTTGRIAEESSAPFRRMNFVGEFTISHPGPTNESVSVFVHYSGIATPGVDYPFLPWLVTIPAGSSSTTIQVVPHNDHVFEGIETLDAALSDCPPETDPPLGMPCFFVPIDPAHRNATVFIRDDGLTGASLVITEPTNGESFNVGETILIEATAIDLDGYIPRVEFWDGEQLAGVSEIAFIQAPPPGTPIQHSFEWNGAAPGAHVLTARATRADGTAIESPAVTITVEDKPTTDGELHAISIYSGVVGGGQGSRNHELGHASVMVDRPGKRVSLLLSSYEPVSWHVNAGAGTIIEKVILGGYYRQQVDGIGADVQVINRFYDEGQGGSDYLWPGTSLESGRFYRVLQKLCDLMGMDLASFQGTGLAPHPSPFVIDRLQNDVRLRCDYPQPVDPSQVPDLSFRLAFNSGYDGQVSFRDYTLHGPVSGSDFFPAWRVVTDAGGRYYYGADFHESWRVDAQTSTLQDLPVPSHLPEFSWPVGIAFDSQRNRILVATLVGEGYLYAYSPASGQWVLVRSLQNEDFDSLVYHAPNDSLYAVTGVYYDSDRAPALVRLNANGEVVGSTALPVQPYGIGFSGFRSELASVGEYLVLLLETENYVVDNGRPEARIYLIDPRNGSVQLTYRRMAGTDTDGDGVPDERDHCPNTPLGASVDSEGCSADQRDADGDGVPDHRDHCPNTPPGVDVDENGCSASQRDSDHDGVTDDEDDCPNTPPQTPVDEHGCPTSSCLPRIEWQANYGGSGPEYLHSVRQVPGGGYIVGGYSLSGADGNKTTPHVSNSHDFDWWVLRLDATGGIIWQRSYGGAGNDDLLALELTVDGGFILGGYRRGGYFAATKLNAQGDVVWDREYEDGAISSIQQLPDGGFILGGWSYAGGVPGDDPHLGGGGGTNFRIVRVDPNGNVIWDRRFGGNAIDQAYAVRRTPDGGFILVGGSNSDVSGNKTSPLLGHADGWVIRFDADGNKLWERAYGAPSGGAGFYAAEITSDGGFALAGGMNGDLWFVRTASDGSKLWERTYSGDSTEGAHALRSLSDGGFILAGQSSSGVSSDKSSPNFGEDDFWLVRIDAAGNKLLDQSFGGDSYERLDAIDLTSDGGMILGGLSQSGVSGNKTSPGFGSADYWIVKLGPEGDCDHDRDGVPDSEDHCPNTTPGAHVDTNGCSASQRDGDHDGVTDDKDECPNTPPNVPVNERGCPRTPNSCAPAIQWQAGLGTDGYERLYRVHQRDDGSYTVGGQDFHRGNGIWIVRLSPAGSNVWERFLGGPGSSYLDDMQPTTDNGYILAGSNFAPGDDSRNYQALLLRIDGNGDVIWTRTYGGQDLDGFSSVRQLPDGGFIAAGGSWAPPDANKTSPHYGEGDVWIVRVDASGNKLWERSYGGTGLENIANIIPTADGGYLVASASESPASGNKTLPGFGGFDGWVLKLDPNGNKIWERAFGTENHDGMTVVAELSNGNILLSGYASSPAGGNKTTPSYGGSDAWLIMLDSDGDKVWERTYGGTDSDGLSSGEMMSDGGFILAGHSQSPISGNKTSRKVGGNDMWLVRIDADGNKIWERTIGGGNPYGSSAWDIALTADGGLIAVGETFNDIGGDKTVPWLGSGDGWVVKLGRENDDCDGDGVPDGQDECPNTSAGEHVDEHGCSGSQRDADGDGVPNDRDECPNTRPGDVVNESGCSIAQLCPCDSPWRSRVEYLSCVVHRAWDFYRAGLITRDERLNIIRRALQSDCGRKPWLEAAPQTVVDLQANGFCLKLSANDFATCVVECSTDLQRWVPIQTNTMVGAEIHIFDKDAKTAPARFYRVRCE